MKTEATLAIERALGYYRPSIMSGIQINKHRNTYSTFEVPVERGATTAGIIDCVMVSEYFGNIKNYRACRAANWRKDLPIAWCKEGHVTAGDCPDRCDSAECKWNIWGKEGMPEILIACIEIKVTAADFKSKNGHNFVGNLNYYAIPLEIFEKIKALVPDDIGILVYYPGGKQRENGTWPYQGLRVKKDATFKEISDNDQKWMLLNVMNRR